MANILVNKELLVTERQTLSGLRAVNGAKNIERSLDVQQYYVPTAPQKHETLDLVVMSDAALVTAEIHAEFPDEKIGSELKELIITAGAVTGAAKWLKTAATVWTKL